MKNLNIGSLLTDAFKDVWKVHKWGLKLLFKPLKNNTQKTSSKNKNNSNNQKIITVSSSLKTNNNKKTNSNCVQLSSKLSTKLNNR